MAVAHLLQFAVSQAPPPFVGGYVFLSAASFSGDPWQKLSALVESVETIPITRVFLSFFDPQMVYVESSNSLQYTGLNVGTS